MWESLIPLATAALGAFSGSKSQTATNKPWLPGNYSQGFDTLLNEGMGIHNTPFRPSPTGRVSAPTSAFESLFSNPEMLRIQQDSDRRFAAQPASQPAIQASSNASSMPSNDIMRGLIAMQGAAGGNKFNLPGSTGIPMLDDPKQGWRYRDAMADSNNQFAGKNTQDEALAALGGVADETGRAGWYNPAGTSAARDKLNQVYRNKHYDPRGNMLDKLAPLIASGLIAGPGLAAGGFGSLLNFSPSNLLGLASGAKS